MWRLKLAGMILGGVVCVGGYDEFLLAKGSQSQPTHVEVLDLEKKSVPPNNYIELGDHLALYDEAVCLVRVKKGEKSGPDTTADYCMYPVISREYAATLAASREEKPSVAFALLVKTKRYPKMSALPGAVANEGAVQGLLVNRIETLRDDAKKLLAGSFPGIDLDKILILEEGRKPSSMLGALGLLVAGLGMALGSVYWMLKG